MKAFAVVAISLLLAGTATAASLFPARGQRVALDETVPLASEVHDDADNAVALYGLGIRFE